MPLVLEVIVLYAVKEFTEIISSYDKNILDSLIAKVYDRRSYNDVCTNILKSVLLPCISTCNVANIASDSIQGILIKLLYVIPNIKSLILPSVQRPGYLPLLVERIQILKNLQEFGFHVGCTTEILKELSKYCPRLQKLSVQHSKSVDDFCIEHLLTFTQLVSLDISDTSVSTNGYRELLLGLTQVQNITWFDPIEPVLIRRIECLPSVRIFAGTLLGGTLLVRKCPNITKLTLISLTSDISGLAELRNVTSLSISHCCYARTGGDFVIKGLGTTLTKLKLLDIVNINIDDLIGHCTVLKTLDIHSCHITNRRKLDHKFPHFRNLKELSLINNFGPFKFSCVLHLYVNLRKFHVVGMGQITDTIIREIVTAGGFRSLIECVVDNCGDMSMDTVWLLMQNCPSLCEIGNIKSWSGVTQYEVQSLLNFLRNNNLSLTVYP
jgi:Leucine-rich repeat (LRR) protein